MKKHNILITGANGQLGRELRLVLANEIDFAPQFTDVEELDITSPEAIEHYFSAHPIDCVVNCAAYTAVDRAESDEQLCRKLNADAVEHLAKAAKAHNARMIHISTDYVFDGTACRPYDEQSDTCPTSVYGLTKLEGEKRLRITLPEDSIIIRTAWLYSPHGKNFVKTMLELGRTRDQLRVVCDQVGTPTYALDLASTIVTILRHDTWMPGIYHFSNEGAISWYDFTMAIHRIAGITGCDVQPCTTDQYPTPARRPSYSVLDKTLIKRTFGFSIPYWEESLAHCIQRLENNNI